MRDKSQLWQQASRFQSLLVLVLMIVAMSLLSDRFLTQANGLNIMRQISVNVCLSIGMTMVILSGGIDLSVGSVLAFSGAITAGLIKSAIPLPWLGVELQFTTWGAIVAGLIVGLCLGWFNGQMITRLKIPPFVATLGMLSIARGMTMLWTKGFPITGLGDGFAILGTRSVLGVPTPVWIAGGLVGVFVLLTKKTRVGRYIYAVGGNEQTARLSGLNVNRIKVIVYTLAGALSAVAGLIMTSRSGLGSAQRGSRIRIGQHRRSRHWRNVTFRRPRYHPRNRHRVPDHRSLKQRTGPVKRLALLATSGQRRCHFDRRGHRSHARVQRLNQDVPTSGHSSGCRHECSRHWDEMAGFFATHLQRRPAMITDFRASKLYRLLHQVESVASVSRRLKMSQKTVRKYRDAGRLPSQVERPERTCRTRPDPLAEFWSEIESLLQQDSQLKPYAILGWLKQKYNPPQGEPRVTDSIRRSLERRVQRWKLQHGVEQEINFPQVHHAGDVLAFDFVVMNSLKITVNGKPLDHMLFHAVFTDSLVRKPGAFINATASHSIDNGPIDGEEFPPCSQILRVFHPQNHRLSLVSGQSLMRVLYPYSHMIADSLHEKIGERARNP